MDFKIKKVKRRNIFARIGCIEHWKVLVECEGQEFWINAWADTDEPSIDRLRHDVERKLKEKFVDPNREQKKRKKNARQ